MEYKKIDDDTFSEVQVIGQVKITELEEKIRGETIAHTNIQEKLVDIKGLTNRVLEVVKAYNTSIQATIDQKQVEIQGYKDLVVTLKGL